MYKYFINQQANSDMYAIISLCIFTIFFTILLVRTIRYRKDYIREMSMLPMEENAVSNSNINNLNEH